MFKKNNITLCIILSRKDLEKNLQHRKIRGSLHSILVLADKNIKEYNEKISKNNIYSFPFKDSFADLRNFAISKAYTDWILFLDADEILSSNFLDEINKLTENKDVDGYWFPRRNYINDKTYLKHGYFYPDYQLRLFRNKKEYRYEGKIHEHLTIPHQKTKKVDSPYIIHNSSHTKYGSFLHAVRLFPYIKVEGTELSQSDVHSIDLVLKMFIEPIKHFKFCYFKEEGFKDGFAGLRAAIIWAFYEGAKYGYALLKRVP